MKALKSPTPLTAGNKNTSPPRETRTEDKKVT